MRGFLVIGNKAVTEPFNINDLPGSAGRMDIMCRCIAQALFISHGVRKDVEIYLLLCGGTPFRAVRVCGGEIRNMAPDERNIAGLIRKALKNSSRRWKRSSPGIYTATMDFDELINELIMKYSIYYLREDGEKIQNVVSDLRNPLFVLGDHLGLSHEMEKVVLKHAEKVLSLSKVSYQADQCILITHYELDKFEHEIM
jgi:tRNA (pseudouridine54-N1)-methyltransferase